MSPMDACSKAWLWLSRAGSSRSPREEEASLRSVSRRSRQPLGAMGSTSHHCTTPMGRWWSAWIAPLVPSILAPTTVPLLSDVQGKVDAEQRGCSLFAELDIAVPVAG